MKKKEKEKAVRAEAALVLGKGSLVFCTIKGASRRTSLGLRGQ